MKKMDLRQAEVKEFFAEFGGCIGLSE